MITISRRQHRFVILLLCIATALFVSFALQSAHEIGVRAAHAAGVGAVAPVDPTIDPGGALSQLFSLTHQSWPIAIMLGIYFFLELTLKFGDADGSPIKAWLDKGRRTLVIAGAIAVIGAALNVLLGGGAVQSAFIAAIAMLFGVWHPQAKEIK